MPTTPRTAIAIAINNGVPPRRFDALSFELLCATSERLGQFPLTKSSIGHDEGSFFRSPCAGVEIGTNVPFKHFSRECRAGLL
jgi:hypothetical protein